MADPFEAARNGDTYLVGRFLDKTNDKDKTDAHGFTVFHWAAQCNQLEVLELLKEKGCDIGKTTNAGDSALHLACSFQHLETVNLLLDWELEVAGVNEHGNTPLHYACFWRNIQICEALIRAGAQIRQLNKYNDEPGARLSDEQRTVLMAIAESCGGTEIVPYRDELTYGREMVALKYVKLELPAENVEVSDEVLSYGLYSTTVLGKWKGSEVAIRKLKYSERMSASRTNNWKREADRLRNLEKPVSSILPIIGAVDLNGVWGIVSQLAPKSSLKKVLSNSNIDLDTSRLYRMASDIVKGMKYLHTLETPIPYIWLTSSICLCDARFNVIINVGQAGFSFNSNFFPVTRHPEYMAPEVLEDFGLQSRKSDVFSFAVILNEMFSRSSPYGDVNPMVIGTKVLSMDIRPEIDEEVTPPHIQRLIQLCWDLDPERRPAFEDVGKVFEKLLA